MAFINILATWKTLTLDFLGCYHAEGLVIIWGDFPAKGKHVVNEAPPPPPPHWEENPLAVGSHQPSAHDHIPTGHRACSETGGHVAHPTGLLGSTVSGITIDGGLGDIFQLFLGRQRQRQLCDPLWFLR